MAFPEVSEQVLRLIDAGVSVAEAAQTVGWTRWRVYDLLRAAGRPAGTSKPRLTSAQRELVLEMHSGGGSVNQAAQAAGVSFGAARRVLVLAGLIATEARPRAKLEARARFQQLADEGWSTARAAREVGINTRTGRDWRRGVRRSNGRRIYPGVAGDSATSISYSSSMTSTPTPISDRFLSLDDRLAIADGLINRQSLTRIAERIGKHKSTVSREIRERSVDGLYLPHAADRVAAQDRKRPKTSKLSANHALRAKVEEGLSDRLSPEQISHRLRRDFPDDEGMRVSHETIYQALYFQARGGLKREIQHALRTGRTRRKPQRRADQRQPRFVDEMIMISERPAEVEDRAVPGHWEGDLIMGAANKTAIGTLVERSTRYTMLVHLPDGHDAEQVRDGLLTAISTLPAHLRGSLTWDQGSEMARHKQFSMAADMQVYFCDPASPWQRGTNENTNGLLRQYFPKGSDLSVHSPADLEHVAQQLNRRPRKTLGWETPAERLRDLLTT